MGTNFYHHTVLDGPVCTNCGHSDDVTHIGKSSAGWCFSLHVYPDSELPKNLEEWEKKFATGTIKDEYGVIYLPNEMSFKIRNRSRAGLSELDAVFFIQNEACSGPNNLARYRISRRCIAHGEGTWDLLVGDFS